MFFPWLFDLLSGSVFLILKTSQTTGAFPRPLTAEEEENYLRLAQAGDMDARNKLVEHNLRLVAHIVKKYYSARDDQDDLISIGTIGLIKAVCSFNHTKGARLATYAARCIENAILSQRNK
ncbi:MAG: sigma-70 family RNA polymerase sigma factor [Butyricicoccaceae bacterium]